MEKTEKIFNLQTLKAHINNGTIYEGELVTKKQKDFLLKNNGTVIFDEATIHVQMLKLGYKVKEDEVVKVKTITKTVIEEVPSGIEIPAENKKTTKAKNNPSKGIKIPDDPKPAKPKKK